MTENEEEEFREKEFKFFLLLNWKTGNVKLYKRKPKHVSPYHIPIKQKFVVKIPRGSELEAEGEIILRRKKVSELSAALLKEEEE